MGLFDKQANRTHTGLFPSTGSDPYSIDNVNNQIDNANTRISDAGYTPQNSDGRNWFEKATNLPQNQNGFLDTLELLARPANAIKNFISKSVIGDSLDPSDSLYRGFAGKDKVSGAELAGQMGLKTGAGKFVVGLGLDLGLDPTTYIPGGVIAKGIGSVAKPIGSLTKGAYGLAESAVPALKSFREGAIQPAFNATKDALGHAFVPQYKWDQTLNGGTDNFLKDLSLSTNNKIGFETENSMNDIGKIAKATGLDNGNDVGRIMENGLQITKNQQELLSDVLKGKDPKVNLAEGDVQDFVGKLNDRILNSGPVANIVKEKSGQLENVKSGLANLDDEFASHAQKANETIQQKLTKISEKHDIKDLFNKQRYDPNSLTKSEINVIDRIEKYSIQKAQKLKDLRVSKEAKLTRLETAQGKLESDLTQTQRGIQFNPLESASQLSKGEGFEILNSKPSLYKKAIGDQAKFLDEIAQKGSFDKVVDPALQPALKPIVEGLLKTGKIVVPNLKGTPELAELQRVMGKDISVLSKKDTTITLKQNNPDKQYFNLVGEKPVIPESLTNANKINPQEGLHFNDIQFTDRGKDLNFERPLRDLSQAPIVHVAAQKLMDSNDVIRQTAKDNNVSIKEMDGYMTHILSEEATQAKDLKKVQGGNFGLGQPNKNVVKQRNYPGSVEDINELHDKSLFNPNAFFATAVGQKRLIEYIHAQSFKNQVLGNKDFAMPLTKGMTVPDGAVVINPDQYKFFKIDNPNGSTAMGMGKGQEYAVTKGVKEALDRYQGFTTDEGTKGMIKMFDGMQNFWKRMALFSPGFHIRNVAGAMFNNTVAGMNPIQLVKYTKEAGSEVINAVKGNESALFREYRSQGLSSSGISKVEFAKMGENPEKGIQRTVENMTLTGKGKAIDAVKHPFETSQKIGDSVDQVNRFALYKWAREAKGMSAEDAAKKVKEVQYDYKDLTPFERNVMKRAIPFYTWSRKNIPFQLKSFINDQRPYEAINKVRLNAQGAAGLDDKSTPDFMKNNFAIPLSQSKMLGLNLPLGDLTKLSSPLKMLTDGLSPIIKTPIEESLNYNFFKGKPIEKFAGQDKKYLGGLAIPAKLDYAIQAATGQIGKGLSTAFGDSGNVDQSNKFKAPSLGLSVVKPYDAQKSIYYQKVDELKKLQDFLQYIQQQTGAKPRTMAEIKKSLKN